MVFAALRVSTTQQDVNNQRHGILAYANNAGMANVKFIEDIASGKIHWRNRKVGELLQESKEGDIILFSEVSRIGRSTLQVLEFIHDALEKKIEVHIVKERLVMDDSISSRVMITMLGLFADIERQFTSTRTKEALAKLKAEGVQLGRPKGKSEKLKLDEIGVKQISEWLGIGLGVTATAKLCQCSRTTLRNYCVARDIKIPKKNKKVGSNGSK